MSETPSPDRAPLEDTIAAEPNALAPYLVYADALLERGDARGELIRLEQSIDGTTPVERARLRVAISRLYRANTRALRKRLDQLERAMELEWRWGFIRRARLELRNRRVSAASALKRLFSEPAARFLVELELGALGAQTYDYGPLVKLLAGAPRSLRALSLGDLEPHDWARPVRLGSLVALNSLTPQLERLAVYAGEGSLQGLALTRLRHLKLFAPAVSKQTFGELASVTQLQLRHLEVVGNEPVRIAEALGALKPFQLESLRLSPTTDTDEVVDALARLPLAKTLIHLDLEGGALSERGVALLTKRRFPALASLRTHSVELQPGPELAARFRACTPATPQRLLQRVCALLRDGSYKKLEPLEAAWRLAAVLPDRPLQLQVGISLAAGYQNAGRISEAQRVLEQSLELQRGAAGADLADTHLRLADVQLGLGEREAAQLYADEALVLGRATKNAHIISEASRILGKLAMTASQWAQAQTHFKDAARHTKNADLARYLGEMLLFCKAQAGNFKATAAKLTKLAAAEKDPAARSRTLGNQGVLLWQAHDWGGAEQAYLASLEAAREARSPRDAGISLMNLGQLEVWRGQPEKALASLTEALALFRQGDMKVMEAAAQVVMADALRKTNDFERCRAVATEARATLQQAGNVSHHTTIDMILADLELYAFRPEEARRLANQALRAHEASGDELGNALVRSKLAYCALLLGDEATAFAELEQARRRFDARGFNHGWPQNNRGLFLVALNRPGDALGPLEQAGALARKAEDQEVEREALAFRSAALASLGRFAEAHQALQRAESLGEPAAHQLRETLLAARQFVVGRESGVLDEHGPRPLSLDARILWEVLRGWAPGVREVS